MKKQREMDKGDANITYPMKHGQASPGGLVVKHLPANAGDAGSSPGSGRSLGQEGRWRRKRQLAPEFLPGESPGQRRLAGLQSMGLQSVRHN